MGLAADSKLSSSDEKEEDSTGSWEVQDGRESPDAILDNLFNVAIGLALPHDQGGTMFVSYGWIKLLELSGCFLFPGLLLSF